MIREFKRERFDKILDRVRRDKYKIKLDNNLYRVVLFFYYFVLVEEYRGKVFIC